MTPEVIILLVAVLLIIFIGNIIFIFSRLKKCPSDKIMVIYGNLKGGAAFKCMHGGVVFIWPFIQSYQYIDLAPISVNVDITRALTSDKTKKINVASKFTVAVSTEEGVMQNAAERLLGLKISEIEELARDIITGQLRMVLYKTDIERIDADRDFFLEAVAVKVETEIKKIGLRLINLNIFDLKTV